jgi:ATPase family protein associated with various cellular activities (AAA)
MVMLTTANRIHIVGASGTGKTTLARALGARLGVDVVHLDELALLPRSRTLRPRAELLFAVHELASGSRWITEGIYLGWTDELFAAADVIVWLDTVDLRHAIRRVIARFLAGAAAEARVSTPLEDAGRLGDYRRELLGLLHAFREIARYFASRGDTDADIAAPSRTETERRVHQFASKVVHCRTSAEVTSLLEGSRPASSHATEA